MKTSEGGTHTDVAMHWRNRKTGETGRWPYTGQDAESMAREAAAYSENTDLDYIMVETVKPTNPAGSE